MANSFFQFKQFRVEQGHCAMKVSTDACIQGAWTPVGSKVKTVLDIGAGTGLLSLMVAQRNACAAIDAIEIDAAAAKQARENVARSAWEDRITVHAADIRQHSFPHSYDLIICNPPFFNNSLLGEQQQRNLARHTVSLSYTDLFVVIRQHLSPGGSASVLLPATEHRYWRDIVQAAGWGITHQLNIIPRVGSKANRVVSLCAGNAGGTIMDEIVIRDRLDNYTPEFINLLQPFYLAL